MRRTRFLFTFENKLYIQRRGDALGSQCVKSGEDSHDAGFIV